MNFSLFLGWKKILRKRKVFGVTGPKKKSSASISVNTPDQLSLPSQQATSSSVHSPTSSCDDPFLSDEDSRTSGNQLKSRQQSEQEASGDNKKNKPKLLSVVSTVKTLNCNSPKTFSVDDGTNEQNKQEYNTKETVQQWKKKGLRKRLGSWRSKKNRSVSESDMTACDYEKEFTEDKDLMEAWFTDPSDVKSTNNTPSSTKLTRKENSVLIFDRKHSSPAHLTSRGQASGADHHVQR